MNSKLKILTVLLILSMTTAVAQAQVPPDIEASLKKIGQIVDPPCTAKLYRPMMPKNDYNTYWPAGAAAPVDLKEPLYPGVALARDVKFGANAKDLIDIFSPEKGGGNRTVLIYVPGGAGNKIEQQDREGERVLRQHRTMGRQEQYDRRHDAAPSRSGLG